MARKLSKNAKKTILNIAILLVLIGVTLTVLLLSYRELNFENIFEFLRSSNVWYIIAAVLCMILSIVFEGMALFVIARRLGHKSKIHQSIAYSSADAYYSSITPSASGGQPASLVYMVRDGMSGSLAGFSLVLNLVAYTMAIIILGIFSFIARPEFFSDLGSGLAKVLVILGFVLQGLLLTFFLMCVFWRKMLVKSGNGVIKLFAKMHITRNEEKWRGKWLSIIDKYSANRDIIKAHPLMFLEALFFNLCQRIARNLIPCFVCFAVSQEASFLDLFCMQIFVLMGYNSVPIPGGVGAFELMYLQTYSIFFDEKFILSSMMVTRVISYYLYMLFSGVYTLTYHVLGIKKGGTPPTDGATEPPISLAEPKTEHIGEEAKDESGKECEEPTTEAIEDTSSAEA